MIKCQIVDLKIHILKTFKIQLFYISIHTIYIAKYNIKALDSRAAQINLKNSSENWKSIKINRILDIYIYRQIENNEELEIRDKFRAFADITDSNLEYYFDIIFSKEFFSCQGKFEFADRRRVVNDNLSFKRRRPRGATFIYLETLFCCWTKSRICHFGIREFSDHVRTMSDI